MTKGRRISFNLLGPQGSGKGTQALAIIKRFNLYLFDAGEELRKIRATGSPLGKEIAAYIDKGNKVPPKVIARVTYQALLKVPADQDVLFDGLLRSLAELEAQKDTFARLDLDLPVIIFLNLDEAAAIERLSKRRICVGCGNRVSVVHSEEEIRACQLCGGRLEARHDDTPEAIRQRLTWYKADTLPVVQYFRKNGTVIDIDAAPPIPEVTQEVLTQVEQYYESIGISAPSRVVHG